MTSITTKIGIDGPEVSTALEAYAVTIGINNNPWMSLLHYENPLAAFETEFHGETLTASARNRDWLAGLRFHPFRSWLGGNARSTHLLHQLKSNLDSQKPKLHRRAGLIANLFALGAWWNGNNDVATALWHRSAAFMTGHGSAGLFADPKIRDAIVASLTERHIIANSDIAAKLPSRFKMGERWPRFIYQSFTQEVFSGNMSGTYAYETPFAFRPVVLRLFPKIRTVHSPDVKVHFRIDNEYANRERVRLSAWAEAGIPTAEVVAHDDNWYARERIIGPTKANLRVGSFYGLSLDTVDEANTSWSRIPNTLVRGGFISSIEEAETFAQHNTAYNLFNGTWTVLRPTRIM